MRLVKNLALVSLTSAFVLFGTSLAWSGDAAVKSLEAKEALVQKETPNDGKDVGTAEGIEDVNQKTVKDAKAKKAAKKAAHH